MDRYIGVSDFEKLPLVKGITIDINEDTDIISGISCDKQGHFRNDLISVEYIDDYPSDKVIEIVLDNSTKTFVGKDQEVLLRDGMVVPAEKLEAGMSIMPFYWRKLNDYLNPGYMVKDFIDGWTIVLEDTELSEPTIVLSDKEKALNPTIQSLLAVKATIGFNISKMEPTDYEFIVNIAQGLQSGFSQRLTFLSTDEIESYVDNWQEFIEMLKEAGKTYNHKIIGVRYVLDEFEYPMYSLKATNNEFIPVMTGIIFKG